jgi:hypothetical protein
MISAQSHANDKAKALLDEAINRACVPAVASFGDGLARLYWSDPRHYQMTLRRLGVANIDPCRPVIESLAPCATLLESVATKLAGIRAETLLSALYSDPDTFMGVCDAAAKNYLLTVLNRSQL